MRRHAVKPVTEVKRRATEVIAEVQRSRRPVLITEHGKAAAVLVDVQSYEALLGQLDVLEGIARGDRAFADGRIVSHADAKKRLSRWLDE